MFSEIQQASTLFEQEMVSIACPVNIPKQGLYRICIGKSLQPVQDLYGQALKHNRACTGALINPLRMHIGPVQDL